MAQERSEQESNQNQTIDTNKIERSILAATLHLDRFQNEAFPHIDPEIFEDNTNRTVFKEIYKFIHTYNDIPTEEAVLIELENSCTDEDSYRKALAVTKNVFSPITAQNIKRVKEDWLFKTTEQYCKDRALYNAVAESIQIMDGSHKKLAKGAIPTLIQKALEMSFTTKIGHDYLEDAAKRYEFYHKQVTRIPSAFDMVNKTTRGGFPVKSLSLYIAPTGVGKTIILCNEAANAMMMGKNVVYITLEMPEEQIARRIDANLMDVSLDELDSIPESTYMRKIDKIRANTIGKLVVLEFPPGSATTLDLRASLKEIVAKKKRKPDLIIIDYLNLLGSHRMKVNNNNYQFGKYLAEEVRALSFEFEVPVLSATQTNRTAQGATDFDMTETSESHGVNMTVDFMCGLITTEQLEEMKQIRMKLLKNRFGPKDRPNSWLVGMDRDKMRMFNLENPFPINDKAGTFGEPGNTELNQAAKTFMDGGGRLPSKEKNFGSFQFGGAPA